MTYEAEQALPLTGTGTELELAVDGWTVTFGTARRGLFILHVSKKQVSLIQKCGHSMELHNNSVNTKKDG